VGGRRKWNPQILLNFPVIKVPRCVSRNAKTLGLQHLTWVRTADLQIDYALAITGKKFCLQSNTPVLTDRTLLLLRRGPSTSNLWVAFFTNWLPCVGQVSCVSRVTPRYCAVSTHCISSPRNSTGLGFWMNLAALTKRTALLFETLMAILQSRSQRSSLSR
jgi:hypothetical protein